MVKNLWLRRIWEWWRISQSFPRQSLGREALVCVMEVSHFKAQKSRNRHALEQRAPSKVPNRVFRPRKSHEWGPPAISQHARVSGRNMIYDARNGAKSETKRCRHRLFANDKCTLALCHTRWCCRLRAFTFAALCVSLLESSCACVIEFFMRAELFCTHIVWCCMSGLRTVNKLWRVTYWENAVAVWEQYTRASTVTHRQSDFSFLTWLQFLISSEKRKLKTVEKLITFMIYCGRWKSNHISV